MTRTQLTVGAAAIAVLPLMLAVLQPFSPAYYGLLLLLPILRGIQAASVSILPLCCLLSAAAGIIVNQPPAVFHPWERLGMFALLMGGIGPLFRSRENDLLSVQLFHLLSAACLLIGSISAAAILFGVGGGSPLFRGLTPHSMILGVVAGIGFLSAFRSILQCRENRNNLTLRHPLGGCACLIALLLSSSRSALLATAGGVLYLLFKTPSGRGFGLLTAGVLLLLILPFSSFLTEGLSNKFASGAEAGSIISSREELWSDRLQEFKEHPFLGVGFASQSIITFAHSLHSGIIEPGSSWLGSLSMLGLCGSIPLFCMIALAVRRGARHPGLPPLSACVLIFFCIHMVFEGYIISAGSILCLLLWSCISAALSSTD